MQKLILSVFLLISVKILTAQITICNGKSYPALVFSTEARQKMEADLQLSKANYDADSSKADHIIWYGRRLAYLGRYDDAIRIFSKGIALHPADARMYRHRGHRYLTTRCYDQAIADFEQATKLINGKPDEMEPDGMPNAKNIPTSSLHSNIWYHLGLAYYLKKDFGKAAEAYKNCLKVSGNNDMYVATANWYYITLFKLGKQKEADSLLKTVNSTMELIENIDYRTILLLYKGEQQPEVLREKLLANQATISNATLGFGLANYYLQNGKMTEGKEMLQRVTAGSQWGSFAYMAAEMLLEE
jgi:tetratricopeptide (TPR) repeat protein